MFNFSNGNLSKNAFICLQFRIVINLWNEDTNWVYSEDNNILNIPNFLFIPVCVEEYEEPDYQVYLPVIEKSCDDLNIRFDLLSAEDIRNLVSFIIYHKKVGDFDEDLF